MLIPDVITLEWLIEAGACETETLRFGRLFPEGIRVTREGLRLLIGHKFDVLFLPRKYRRKEEDYQEYTGEWWRIFNSRLESSSNDSEYHSKIDYDHQELMLRFAYEYFKSHRAVVPGDHGQLPSG